MSQRKIKVISFFILVIPFELISFFIGIAFISLDYFNDNGLTISGDLYQSIYLSNLSSPFKSLLILLDQKNPVYIALALGSIALSIYILVSTKNEKSYQIESKYAVHGSQRWGTYSDIVHYKDIRAVSQNDLFSYVVDSINAEERCVSELENEESAS